MDYSLPRPTDDELNLGNKVEYFNRILDANLHKKYKLEIQEMCEWIHHNYSSIFLTNNELSYNQYKKLIK